MNIHSVRRWELLTKKKLHELTEGDGGSVFGGLGAGVALLKTRHLRKDPNEVRGEPLPSGDE